MCPAVLVNAKLAKVGNKITYNPEQGTECEKCDVRKVCQILEAGRTYEVKEVKTLLHPCAIHKYVRMVVYEEVSPG